MNKLIAIFLILLPLTNACQGRDVEADVLKYFYLDSKISAEGNPKLVEAYIPEEGFVIIDQTVDDPKEIRCTKKQYLDRTPSMMKLRKSGQYHTSSTPQSITQEGNKVVVESEMIEVITTEENRGFGVYNIRNTFEYKGGQLMLLKSEMLHHEIFKLPYKK